MKKINQISLFAALQFLCLGIYSQDSLQLEISKVVVSERNFSEHSEGYFTKKIEDSLIQHYPFMTTDLLRQNTNIYFKENGYGMVSSPSFRGTNASHTAVVWNGLNINSQLNGQTDFFTITPADFNSIQIRRGGGSVHYGSGAIGGTIHLNNDLKFNKQFQNKLTFGYGAFDTKSLQFRQNNSNGAWSYNIQASHISSENDYPISGIDQNNENGQFKKTSINANAGILNGKDQEIKLYHRSFLGNRNLSSSLVAPGRSKYEDEQHQSQIVYDILHKKSTSQLRLAHLYEQFKYFENKGNPQHSAGEVRTLLAKYNYEINFSECSGLQSFIQYNNLRGDGSDLENPQRNELAVSSTFQYVPLETTSGQISIRKDFTENFETPLVIAINGKHAMNDQFALKVNASRNMKLPTFNDLFWNPGGNAELLPEQSLQVDVGTVLELDNVNIEMHAFQIETKNMIRWLPSSNQLWSPVNEDSVTGKGVEADLQWKEEISSGILESDFGFSHTISKNDETGEKLIYTPKNRFTASLNYKKGIFQALYQQFYTGSVSYTGGELDGYSIANASIGLNQNISKTFTLGINVMINNLYNTYYENVVFRPMPGRNLQSQLSIKF